MKIIKDQTFDEERALYNLQDATVENCRFEGPRDGESFLKEAANITVKDCYMDLRYPMWHVNGLMLSRCEMTKNCRAALWYVKGVKIEDCLLNGIKVLRECENIALTGGSADSPEMFWRCKNIMVSGGKITSEYAFLNSENIEIENLEFTGKYSFQYTKNVLIQNSRFQTKDAFWHSHNVTVKNSVLEGEYIGWYSDGLTLINCHIKGTQPFCYCKNLKLVNCTTEQCDLSFEYSDVNAEIKGEIESVKNPLHGKIVADRIGEIILRDSKYNSDAEIKSKS